VAQGDIYSTVESVKAAEQVYAPVSGEIVAVNDDLEANPELINEDPYGAAWIIKVKPSDAGELDALMDAAAYESLLAEHE
ncbi:MAG: glycine cleavage system protein H, partial [Anaerolineae bacterium]|nr:glycine cleavage system protein H [Anaerolineae bacterium]